ncbi:MAG: VOC family protein [Myxococcales bacterium]|nr:VOC family protein [Myxococcales bacterium]
MRAAEQTDRHELHGAQTVLLVGDVRKTVAFYCDVLGFRLDFEWGDPPTHARVSSGDRSHASAARIHFHEADPTLLKHKTCSIYVHVGNDLDELCRELKSRGVEVVEEPTERPWGRQFGIHDINGFLLLFLASS